MCVNVEGPSKSVSPRGEVIQDAISASLTSAARSALIPASLPDGGGTTHIGGGTTHTDGGGTNHT
jgi:hypothetical protein